VGRVREKFKNFVPSRKSCRGKLQARDGLSQTTADRAKVRARLNQCPA
jgi:hypothetical protein